MPTITSPDDGVYSKSKSVVVTWEGSDATSDIIVYQYRIGSGGWSSTTSSLSHAFSNLAEGTHIVQIKAIDRAGNEATAEVTLTVDTTKPTLTISSPAAGSYHNVSSVTVTWSGSDATSGIAGYQYSINGVNWYDVDNTVFSHQFAGLADGSYTVGIRAFDRAGNFIEKSVIFTVDTALPTLAIDWPINGAYLKFKDIEATWASSDIGSGSKEFQYKLDNGGWTTTNLVKEKMLTGLSEGTHTLYVRAYDNAGNFAEASVAFIIDTIAPDLIIWHPASDSFLNNPDVQISWSATDATTHITGYEYNINGGTWSDTSALGHTFTNLGDVSHIVGVRAYDKAGNCAEKFIEFTVDTGLPELDITSPSNNEYLHSKNVWVSWIAIDEGSGIKGYQYRIDDGKWSDIIGSSSTTHSFMGLEEGKHTVTIRAIDKAGNSATATVSFFVDTTKPVLTITSPNDNEVTGSKTVTWSAIESGSGIERYLYSTDGTNWFETSVASHIFNGLVEGWNTVHVKAVDKAGNEADVVEVKFFLDTKAPVLAIESPTDGSFTNSKTVTWTVIEGGSGIAEYWYSTNGVDWTLIDDIDLDATSYAFNGLVEGKNTLHIKAVDRAGNEGIATVSFTVDTTKPTLNIGSSINNAYFNSNEVTVSWIGADDRSGINHFEVRIEGVIDWARVDGSTRTFHGLLDGSHTVMVRAVDNAGNEGDPVGVTFTVDTKKPELEITSPSNNEYFNHEDVSDDGYEGVTVSWTGDDGGDESGITEYRYRINGGVWKSSGLSKSVILDLSDGRYIIDIMAIDRANNVNETSVAFIIDTIAPDLIIWHPAEGSFLNTPDVQISWSATDATSVTGYGYNINGGTWISTTATGHTFPMLGDGTYTVGVRAYDEAGNCAEKFIEFTVDTELPLLSINSPNNDDPLKSNNVQVSWSATDVGGSGIVGYQYYIDNGGWSGLIDPSSTSHRFEGLGEGSHTVVIRAIDNAGNSVTSTVTFFVDTIEPEVSITSPGSGQYFGPSIVQVSWHATDDGSGIASHWYSIDGGATWSPTTTGSFHSFTNLGEGEHIVQIKAIDRAGNEAIASVMIIVDVTPPTLTIDPLTSVPYLNHDDVTITWTSSDGSSGLKEFRYKLDGGEWITTGLIDEKELIDLSEGVHTFHVRAYDNADNFAEAVIVFMVDTVKPMLNIDSPDDGSFLKDPWAAISWSATDTTTAVTRYEYSIDGGVSWSEPTTATNYLFETLVNGLYTVKVRAYDQADNFAEAAVTFTVDLTKPTLKIDLPGDNTYLDSKTVRVSWSATDVGSEITGYQYRIDGGAWLSTTAKKNIFSGLSNGIHTVEIMAFDRAGNEAVATVTFTVDTVKPTLTIVSPTGGAYLNHKDVVVSWSATDSGSGIKGYQYSVNGGVTWEDIDDYDPSAPSHRFTVPEDGTYTVMVRAVDRAGNTGAPHEVTFTVDTVLPETIIDSPINNAYLDSKAVMVSWLASDDGSGIAGYQYRIGSGGWSSMITDSSKVFTGLGEGEHTVEVKAIDRAGNEAITTVTFTVDTVAPTLVIDSPSNGALLNIGEVTMEWSASDATSGLKEFQYKLDNGDWTTTNLVKEKASAGLSEGVHTFRVRAYDHASNFAEAAVTFTVDTVAPDLTLWSPADGSFLNNPDVPISWSATDATTVVTRYEYSTDGGETWTSTYATGRTFTSLADGRHAIQVRAYDQADNFAEASVTFTVDTELPLLNIGSPSNGDFIDSKDVWVSWIATDEGSGIKGYHYRIDSGKWCSTTEASHLLEDLGEGSHTVVIRAIDNAGNSVTAMVTFVVDTVPPSLSITSPDDGSVLSTTWVEISWSATDATTSITGYQYRINSGGVWSEWSGITLDLMHNFTGLADGQHITEVRAYDLLGNMAEARLDVTIDTLGPQVEFTHPAGGSCINTGEVTISWTGDDATTAVAGYQYRINGGDWKPIGLAESITLELPDGEYTIEVMAYDIVDNEGITSLYFIMDSTDPTVTIVEPNDGAYLDSGDVHVEWTGDDATSGIKSYQYRINGGAWSENTTATSHIFTGLADGVYVIEVRSWDRSNNSASVQVSVTVDTVPPTIDIESPQEGAYLDDRSITVAWSSTDPASELVGLKYRLDSGAWSELIALQDLRFEGLDDGLHMVEIKLFDLAGNNSTATVAFTVDTTKPTLIIDSPIGGAHLDSKDVTVEWSATDATGIAGYQYRIDGGAWSENTTMASHTFTGLADGKHTVQVRAYDLAGNFVEAYVDLFVDTTDPEIIAHTPSGTGVPVDTSISTTFSEEMVHDSLVFTISGADGVISWKGNTATFSPYSDLVFGRTYSVSVYGKDLSGNSVTAQWTFTAVPNGTVSGKIVYKDGSPIANATVSSGGKSVTTDANGEFLIDLVKGQHDLIVSLNGKEIGMFNATTVPGEMNDLGELIFYDTDITLRDVLGWIALAALIALLLLLLLLAILRRRSFYVVVNGIMEGKVLDLKDRPIEGATVILETGQAAVTDAEGGFSLDVTPRTYGMTVEKDGRKSPVFLVTVAPGQTYTSEVKRMEKGN